ncbi:uncharacterized protein UHOD_11727 [Ustilago sp. UG-2017b]|nr:uncharacterized protein UHOD_11727 [Ustilago sp. UG-2017b]
MDTCVDVTSNHIHTRPWCQYKFTSLLIMPSYLWTECPQWSVETCNSTYSITYLSESQVSGGRTQAKRRPAFLRWIEQGYPNDNTSGCVRRHLASDSEEQTAELSSNTTIHHSSRLSQHWHTGYKR